MEIVQRVMVAGFMFHARKVLLVCKQKPEWQCGLWNAVGGKVEEAEVPVRAMVREFLEEVGIQTLPGDWTHFATELGPDYCVHYYRAQFTMSGVTSSMNDANEPLAWFDANDTTRVPVIGSVRWLLPLAQDWRRLRNPVLFHTDDDIREKASW